MASPDQPLQAGLFHLQRGELPQAENALQTCLRMQPGNADAMHFMGLLELQRGRLGPAEKWIRQAIAKNPREPACHANLGEVLRRQPGRAEEAIALLAAAAGRFPESPHLWHTLGLCLAGRGRHGQAAAAVEKAIARQPSPASLTLLARVLINQGRHAEAQAPLKRALGLDPADANAHVAFGDIECKACNPGKALGWFSKAAELNPRLAEAHAGLAKVRVSLGLIPEGLESHRRAMACNPRDPAYASSWLLSLHYQSPAEPAQWAAHHREIGRALMQGVAPAVHPPRQRAGRRLKVGYVSGDFREHPVAFFMESVLRHHDRQTHEIFCYHDSIHADAWTERLKSHAGHWAATQAMDADELAARVRADGIDILVDLAGHTGGRMDVFARKPAPIQATYLGYPDTTGLPAMDCRIVDAVTDPPGEADGHCSERLVRLPGCFLCYTPPAHAPAVGPPPAAGHGGITFANFNKLAKITPEWMALLARILANVPHSRCLFKCFSWGQQEDFAMRRLESALAACGVDPGRLVLLPSAPSHEMHLAHYGQADIALDTFPYNGTTTTCEALWMGVPVVTLAGQAHVARVGASLLAAAGLAEWVAQTPDDYVRIAVERAGDPAGLASLRQNLRAKMAPLTDGAAFAAKLEDAYQGMAQAQWGATGG